MPIPKPFLQLMHKPPQIKFFKIFKRLSKQEQLAGLDKIHQANTNALSTLRAKQQSLPNTWTVVSWNANSVRERHREKSFEKILQDTDADVFFIFEAKTSLKKFLGKQGVRALLRKHQLTHRFEHISTIKPAIHGYAGVIILSKHKPTKIEIGINNHTLDKEGRCLTIHFPHITITGVYLPNSGNLTELTHLDKKILYTEKLEKFCSHNSKIDWPYLLLGDMNIAPLNGSKFGGALQPNNASHPSCHEKERISFSKLTSTLRLSDQIEKFGNKNSRGSGI